MRKKLLLVVLVLMVALIAAIPALAIGPVVGRVHAGGPDLCEAIGLPVGCNANFSLVANLHADGSVTGQYSDQFGHGNGGFHAAIDCLSISGDDAWVSGLITQDSTGAGLTGLLLTARVRDNGTNANDPADQISFSVIDDVSCDTQPDYDLFDAPQGQVRVN